TVLVGTVAALPGTWPTNETGPGANAPGPTSSSSWHTVSSVADDVALVSLLRSSPHPCLTVGLRPPEEPDERQGRRCLPCSSPAPPSRRCQADGHAPAVTGHRAAARRSPRRAFRAHTHTADAAAPRCRHIAHGRLSVPTTRRRHREQGSAGRPVAHLLGHAQDRLRRPLHVGRGGAVVGHREPEQPLP